MVKENHYHPNIVTFNLLKQLMANLLSGKDNCNPQELARDPGYY